MAVRFFFALGFIFIISTAASAGAFNETFNEDGQLRAPYQEFLTSHFNPLFHGSNEIELVFPDQKGAFVLLDRPLDDAIRILPTPVLLSSSEYMLLQKASAQRARALVDFFDDIVHHGGHDAISAHIFSAKDLASIFQVETSAGLAYGNIGSLMKIYRGSSRSRYNFWLGPDYARAESGQFVALEDNVGLLSGTEDAAAAYAAFLQLRLNRESEVASPLRTAIERFLIDIPFEKWGAEVAAVLPMEQERKSPTMVDEEDSRRRQTLNSMGIHIVTQQEIEDPAFQNKLLNGEIKKIVNFTDIAQLRFSARVIQNLLNAFTSQRVEFMISPGMDRLGNKAILSQMDHLIRLYLGEKPLVPTVFTECISTSDKIDSVISEIQGRKTVSPCVIKQTNIAQGTNIYFPQSMSPDAREALVQQILEFHARGQLEWHMDLPYFVRQQYIDQSFVPAGKYDSWARFMVDFRPLNYVYRSTPDNRPMVWGRANLKIPNALTDTSHGGLEAVVLTPKLCADVLAPRR